MERAHHIGPAPNPQQTKANLRELILSDYLKSLLKLVAGDLNTVMEPKEDRKGKELRTTAPRSRDTVLPFFLEITVLGNAWQPI